MRASTARARNAPPDGMSRADGAQGRGGDAARQRLGFRSSRLPA